MLFGRYGLKTTNKENQSPRELINWSSSSAPARVRAEDSSAIRTLPSVVDNGGECHCEGPACDRLRVGSGHIVYCIEGGGRGCFSFSCLRLRLSKSVCFLAVSNGFTLSLDFLLQALLS